MTPVVEVVGAGAIQERVGELGRILSEDYADRRPVVVAVMTGAMWFAADLVRAMPIELEVDFLSLNRFGEGGRIRIATDSATPLSDRHVILVEDIVDTGLSLSVLHRMLAQRQPASLRSVALLDKSIRRLVDVELTYRGFEMGDEYLIGYGLDHRGRFRNLPSLWAVLDLDVLDSTPEVIADLTLGAGSPSGGGGGR